MKIKIIVMLKVVLCGIALILIVSISGCTSKENPPLLVFCGEEIYGLSKGDSIDFQFHSRYEVDTSGLRERFGVVEGTQFTFIVQLGCVITWNGMLNSLNNVRIEYDDYDFNFDDYPDKFLIITFGRELHEIQFIDMYASVSILSDITFAEEYHGDVMFLYTMDAITLRMNKGGGYYIMSGEEKVFIGNNISDLNE